jgi:hypothetical protein
VFAPRYVNIIRGAELIVSFMTLAQIRQGQNGITDEKFRKPFPTAKLNEEHRTTLDELLD